MDGWVTIGTKLDSKQLEKDLKDAERRLQQFEKEAERLSQKEVKAKIDLEDYYKQKELIEQSTDKMLEHAQTEEHVNSVLEMEKSNLQQLNEAYAKQLTNAEEINKKIQENAHNQALVRNEIQQTTSRLQQTTAYDNVKKKIDSIGNSISGVIKKVGRWALAVFGIRSAYLFVRQAMSTLTQYNDQIATDVEYIRFALATALQPVIEFIIQLAYKLLSLLGYIAKILFGVNIFANSTADAFSRTKKEIGGSTKAAKELKKQLAGFDEMNILQDDTSSGGGGGAGGGGGLPSFDLGDIGEPDFTIIYSWADKLKEIFNNVFDKIKENVKKVMKDLGFSEEFIKAWEFAVEGVRKIINGLLDFISGLLEFIVGLVTGDTEKVKEGIKKMAIGIWEIISGLVQTILGVFGMILATLWSSLIKPIIETVKDMVGKVGNFFTGLWNGIINGVKTAWNGIKNVFSNMPSWFSGIIGGVLNTFKKFGTTIGGVVGGAFKTVINGVLSWIENQLNRPINAINSLISTINKVPGISIGRLSSIRLPRLAKGGILNYPGKGVPVGGAIAGEAGREFYMPLQDEQMLSLVGQAIGKYITVNANITNTMNGRVISRELQKINNESDFAFNR